MAENKFISITDQMAIALLELMANKEFTDITVTELIKKAGIARASFYRNFDSTIDVLDYATEKIAERIHEEILPAFISRNERKWRELLFHLIYELNDPRRNLANKNPSNRALLFNKMNALMQKNYSDNMDETNIKQFYQSAACAGAITSTIGFWFDHGKKETPEELVDIIVEILMRIQME